MARKAFATRNIKNKIKPNNPFWDDSLEFYMLYLIEKISTIARIDLSFFLCLWKTNKNTLSTHHGRMPFHFPPKLYCSIMTFIQISKEEWIENPDGFNLLDLIIDMRCIKIDKEIKMARWLWCIIFLSHLFISKRFKRKSAIHYDIYNYYIIMQI